MTNDEWLKFWHECHGKDLASDASLTFRLNNRDAIKLVGKSIDYLWDDNDEDDIVVMIMDYERLIYLPVSNIMYIELKRIEDKNKKHKDGEH